jgi:hypothetical protein
MQGLDAKQQRTVTRNNVVGIFWKQCIDASSIFQVVLSTLRLLRWAVVTALRIRTWQHSAGGGGQVRACFLCPRGVPGGKAQDHNIWRTREPFTDFSVENTNRPSSTMKHGAQNNDAATLDEEGVDTVINSRKYCTYVRNACLVDTHFPLSFIRNELWSPVSHSQGSSNESGTGKCTNSSTHWCLYTLHKKLEIHVPRPLPPRSMLSKAFAFSLVPALSSRCTVDVQTSILRATAVLRQSHSSYIPSL